MSESVWVIGGVTLTGEDRSTNRKICKKCPLETPYEVARDRTVASRAEDQHLSA
jgi:hypothetical protein